MAVVTRRRGVRVLVVVAAAFPLLLAGGAALLTVVIGGTCTGSGVGDAPSALAVRDIPASFLRIYEQVGAQFKIPWEVLAGIGKEECDHGRDPDPSCTPQPGATRPGGRELRGRVGADADRGRRRVRRTTTTALRHYLPDPVAGAARSDDRGRARRAGADQGRGRPDRAADRRLRGRTIRAYNGSGPAADAYAARVLADAHAYQGAGTAAFGPSCSAALGTPLVPGTKARILPSGDAAAPGGRSGRRAGDDRGRQPDRSLPLQLRRRARRGRADDEPNARLTPPRFRAPRRTAGPGYDCSSATDYVLYGGGFGQTLLQGERAGVDDARERRRSGSGEVGDDLRQRRPRLHRGRGHLPRHRGGRWATRPTRRPRGRGGAPSGPGRPGSSSAIRPGCDRRGSVGDGRGDAMPAGAESTSPGFGQAAWRGRPRACGVRGRPPAMPRAACRRAWTRAACGSAR